MAFCVDEELQRTWTSRYGVNGRQRPRERSQHRQLSSTNGSQADTKSGHRSNNVAYTVSDIKISSYRPNKNIKLFIVLIRIFK